MTDKRFKELNEVFKEHQISYEEMLEYMTEKIKVAAAAAPLSREAADRHVVAAATLIGVLAAALHESETRERR